SIFIGLIFINLQIPLPATPLFAHLYKTTGVYGAYMTFRRADVPTFRRSPVFPCIYELFVSLEKLKCFTFRLIQTLFAKHRGWGSRFQPFRRSDLPIAQFASRLALSYVQAL